jgi:cytoskeletal protein RodZ
VAAKDDGLSNGLSSSAVRGIAAGIAIAVLAILGGGLLLWWLLRRQRRRLEAENASRDHLTAPRSPIVETRSVVTSPSASAPALALQSQQPSSSTSTSPTTASPSADPTVVALQERLQHLESQLEAQAPPAYVFTSDVVDAAEGRAAVAQDVEETREALAAAVARDEGEPEEERGRTSRVKGWWRPG